MDHLFGSFAEEFRHGQMEHPRHLLDLLVNRVWQFNFGFFHIGRLRRRVAFLQDRVPDLKAFPLLTFS